MDWTESAKTIRELWPDAIWNDTLRDVWRKALESLDQEGVHEALVSVKKTYASQQPEIKWVLQCYSTIQNERRLNRYTPIPRGEKHLIQTPDEKSEQSLFQEWRAAIDGLVLDEAETIKTQIITQMESGKLSSPTAYKLLIAVGEKTAKEGT